MVMQLCCGQLGNNSRLLYNWKTKQSWRAGGQNTYPSQLGFSYDWKNTTAASIVNPSVIEVSTTSFLPQEALLSVQPAVDVKYSHFYCYSSESDDSDKSICSSETIRWKLFSFSLTKRARRWCRQTIESIQGDWEMLCSKFCLSFFPISRVVSLRIEVLTFKQKEIKSLSASWDHFNSLITIGPDLAILDLMLL